MKILSLFDGVSCARLAIERAGIPIEAYYASEIDKYAIKVTQANRPDTIQIGSVKDFGIMESICIDKIDLLIGGSPCQDLSIAKKDRKGLEGNRSSLFYEYVRILNEVKPKYFILENVASMPQKDKDIISQTLGVQPVMINASLVSAQNRKRLFWVGKLDEFRTYKQVEIPQPEDKKILLKDILENGDTEKLKSYCIDANYYKGTSFENYDKKGRRQLIRMGRESVTWDFDNKNYWSQQNRAFFGDKFPTLPAGNNGDKTKVVTEFNPIKYRKLTPIECERLQGMPDKWTNPTGDISNSQRYKMCGNAFNVDVVAHIIRQLAP